MAAEGGYTEVVGALLEAGANPKEENGVTVLFCFRLKCYKMLFYVMSF
jgi:hypothetical protein